jgi:serine phosphatase RsbU (regulator of sigma subunit)
MFEHYGSEQLVTLLYVLLDPARDEAVIGNAGHPPPVLVRADGTLVELSPADGPPLGVGLQERGETVVGFGMHDTVIAFTDGLIERRGEDITEGQRRVAHAAQAHHGSRLADVVAALVEQVGDPSRDDDIAVIGARRLA